MVNVLSGWMLVLGAGLSVIVVVVISIDQIENARGIVSESYLRLLSLTLGVPLVTVLAFEGIVTGWSAGLVISGVVTFATKPWSR